MELEKNLKELEILAEKMSSGELTLKESLEAFKKGMILIQQCQKDLKNVEQSVEKLIRIDPEGKIETEKFQFKEEEEDS